MGACPEARAEVGGWSGGSLMRSSWTDTRREPAKPEASENEFPKGPTGDDVKDPLVGPDVLG